MNILILSGHPAQVHNFRLLRSELEARGHKVYWLATNKDISKYLLDYYKINFELLDKPGKTFINKLKTLINNTVKCIRTINTKKIDIIISRVSPYASLAGKIKNIPHIALADTETSGIYDTIFTKFVNVFMTARSFNRTLRKDQIRFSGNIELFYLHPKRYSPPEPEEVKS